MSSGAAPKEDGSETLIAILLLTVDGHCTIRAFRLPALRAFQAT